MLTSLAMMDKNLKLRFDIYCYTIKHVTVLAFWAIERRMVYYCCIARAECRDPIHANDSHMTDNGFLLELIVKTD